MRLPLMPFVVAMVAGVACASALAPAPPVVTPAGVRFVVAYPEARSVALAGSFNQWSTVTNPLAPSAVSGIWTTVVPLPPGEHLFMYVVDGDRWISPPQAHDYAEDGFGLKNGIVVVRPAE